MSVRNFTITCVLSIAACTAYTGTVDDLFVSASSITDEKRSNESAEDEEVYDADTVVVDKENSYNKFYNKVKNSIAKISVDGSSFYGVVVKDKTGIYVISDKNSTLNGKNVSVSMLDNSKKLHVQNANVSNDLVSFKLKAPLPKQLNPIEVEKRINTVKAVSLAAVSFDYGDEPEVNAGKGKGSGDRCQISSELRRCRPGSPLFSPSGKLFGIVGWNPKGNVGLTIHSQKRWKSVAYPFTSTEKGKSERRKKSRRYSGEG